MGCPTQEFVTGWTSSYGYNWQYLLDNPTSQPYPFSNYQGFFNPGLRKVTVRQPSETLSFADQKPIGANLWTYLTRPGDSSSNDGFGRVDLRHAETANAVFLDGHANALSDEVIDPTLEKVYWDPT